MVVLCDNNLYGSYELLCSLSPSGSCEPLRYTCDSYVILEDILPQAPIFVKKPAKKS